MVQLRPPCPGSQSQHSTPCTPLSERIPEDGYTNCALTQVSVWGWLSYQPFLANLALPVYCHLALYITKNCFAPWFLYYCQHFLYNKISIIMYWVPLGLRLSWNTRKKSVNHFSFSTFHIYKNKTFELHFSAYSHSKN